MGYLLNQKFTLCFKLIPLSWNQSERIVYIHTSCKHRHILSKYHLNNARQNACLHKLYCLSGVTAVIFHTIFGRSYPTSSELNRTNCRIHHDVHSSLTCSLAYLVGFSQHWCRLSFDGQITEIFSWKALAALILKNKSCSLPSKFSVCNVSIRHNKTKLFEITRATAIRFSAIEGRAPRSCVICVLFVNQNIWLSRVWWIAIDILIVVEFQWAGVTYTDKNLWGNYRDLYTWQNICAMVYFQEAWQKNWPKWTIYQALGFVRTVSLLIIYWISLSFAFSRTKRWIQLTLEQQRNAIGIKRWFQISKDI